MTHASAPAARWGVALLLVFALLRAPAVFEGLEALYEKHPLPEAG